jgi:hypothetical protein
VIKTEPNGATVKIGDTPAQMSPTVFSEVRPGPYPVSIEHDGYEPKTFTVEVKPSQPTDLGTITLARSKGLLKITTNPEGLAYEMRSESNPFQPLSGVAPMEVKELETGNYEIKVTRKGWPLQTRTATVTRGIVRQVFFDFAGSDVTITSTPPGAAVFREKEQLGVTPLSLKDWPPGEVKYTLALAGYENATVQGNVQAGQPLTFSESLKKARPRTVQSTTRRSNTNSSRPNNETDERSERIKRAFIPYYDVFRK